ncbi:hypothetical protein [Haladaptatus sp. R4]|uniref:hypothetical protein n=1 Tax=Haladaptatus sp. R4 TaxID=1679489 RepID=UPI0012375786|nr:hypothetical protein [Haladaptatus sp. R4]
MGTVRRRIQHTPLKLVTFLGVLVVALVLSLVIFSDKVLLFGILGGGILAILLFVALQFRVSKLSRASEIPASAVTKIVYVDGGKRGITRYLVYFETEGETNVRVLSMGTFGDTIGDVEGARRAFGRAGLEVTESELNDSS